MKNPATQRATYEDRRATVAVVALALSLIAHLSAYRSISERSFAFFEPVVEKVRETIDKRHTMRTEAFFAEPQAPAPADPLQTSGDSHAPHTPPAAFIEQLSGSTPATAFEPPAASREPLSPQMRELLAPPPAKDLPAWQPREEILSIANPPERNAIAPIPRREIPRVERQKLAPDISLSYNLVQGLSQGAAPSGDELPVLTSPLTVIFDPDSELPAGGSAELPETRLGPEAEGDTSTTIMAELPAGVTTTKPIENKLSIAVETFQAQRRSDGYLYFKIDIFRKDADTLPRLPRDIVFIQDTSGSLGERYLHPCRLALLTAIQNLHPEDRFNIVSFSHTVERCFDTWRSPAPESLSAAFAFIDSLKSEGATDLFGSMSEVLRMERAKGRPMMALVMTDGQITAGQIERDSQIIGAFTKMNSGDVSVFTVGTSPRANRFLLDMLSYCNRGGHSEIVPDRFSVQSTIDAANASIARPVLSDLRFNFDSSAGAEVYPTLTTGLYEDRPLQLFGRVSEKNPVVAFQARGKSGTTLYDMLFVVDLLEGESAQGDKELRERWAMQKMYDLVARYAKTEDAAIIAEMQALHRKYRVPMPYSSRRLP